MSQLLAFACQAGQSVRVAMSGETWLLTVLVLRPETGGIAVLVSRASSTTPGRLENRLAEIATGSSFRIGSTAALKLLTFVFGKAVVEVAAPAESLVQRLETHEAILRSNKKGIEPEDGMAGRRLFARLRPSHRSWIFGSTNLQPSLDAARPNLLADDLITTRMSGFHKILSALLEVCACECEGLDTTEYVARIEREFEIDVPDPVAGGLQTLGDLCEYIAQQGETKGRPLAEETIWREVRRITSEEFGLDASELHHGIRYVEDLCC